MEPLLASIAVPTLIIWGEKDGWLSPSLARRLHNAIPRSALKLIPNADHFAMEARLPTWLTNSFAFCKLIASLDAQIDNELAQRKYPTIFESVREAGPSGCDRIDVQAAEETAELGLPAYVRPQGREFDFERRKLQDDQASAISLAVASLPSS